MTSTLTRLSLILASTTVAAVVVSGQTPTPPPTAQTQGATFKVAANHVSTDVKVWNDKHQFVPDIRRDEFHIFEDGVEQKIEEFTLTAGGRVLTDIAPPPPAVTEGIIVPPKRAQMDLGGRIFVIFIDDMHLQPLDTPSVRQVLRTMRDTLLHDNDLITIVSTGYSSLQGYDLMYDMSHTRLNDAIEKVSGSGATPKEILDMPQTAEGLAEVKFRVNVAFKTAYDILSQLEHINGRRKSFIYISNGYDFNPFAESRLQNEQNLYNEFYAPVNKPTATGSQPDASTPASQISPLAQGQPLPTQSGLSDPFINPFAVVSAEFSDSDLVREIAELIRAANRANTTFYTVDPRGLSAGPPLDTPLTLNEWYDFLNETTSSLQVLAKETGGIAGVNTNDFKKIFRDIDNDSSDYYVLGYYSNNPDPLKRTRKLDVKVSRAGVTVGGFRQSYSIKIPPKGK